MGSSYRMGSRVKIGTLHVCTIQELSDILLLDVAALLNAGGRGGHLLDVVAVHNDLILVSGGLNGDTGVDLGLTNDLKDNRETEVGVDGHTFSPRKLRTSMLFLSSAMFKLMGKCAYAERIVYL